jgi:16S rRNA (uracil1498-N3)-methyltransferase
MPTHAVRTLPRFLAPDLDLQAAEVRLGADESHHLSRVLRLGIGDRVAVFDGRGREFVALVTHAAARAVLTLLEEVDPVPEAAVRLTLLQSVLKGAAMDEIVRDATMMGAASIRPVLAAHLAVKPSLAARAQALERWRRLAVASAKQCRRAVVPDIREPATLLRSLQDQPADLRLILIEPSAARAATSLREVVARPQPPAVSLAVGPEGGWTDEELDDAMAAGAEPVSIGPMTLRASSVPLAVLAVCRVAWS